MALNDTLTGEGNTEWWHAEVAIQFKRRRRDNDLENERAEETEETDE